LVKDIGLVIELALGLEMGLVLFSGFQSVLSGTISFAQHYTYVLTAADH